MYVDLTIVGNMSIMTMPFNLLSAIALKYSI